MKTPMVVFAALAIGCVSAGANLIINGSFEEPEVSGFGVFNSVPGWTGYFEIQHGSAGSSYSGNQHLELDAYSNGSASQVVITTVRTSYTFSFAYSPRHKQSAETNPVEAWFNDTLLGTFTGVGGEDSIWTVHSFTVTGTGSDTVKFVGVGDSDSYGGYIDDVQLNLAPIPEPTTLIGGALLLVPLFFGQARKQIRH